MVLDVIPKFDGKRVKIAYDRTYPAMSLVFHHILPEFKSKRLVVGVYSDVVCRSLREYYRFLSSHAPEMAKYLIKRT